MEKMMWNKLSMKDRAFLIKLGIQNGITDLGEIRGLYEDSHKYSRETNTENPKDSWYKQLGKAILEDSELLFKQGGSLNHRFSGEEDTGLVEDILNIFKKEKTPTDTRKTAGPVDLDEIRIRQAWAESKYDDNAKSRAGARGRFQIMPAVQADYIKAGGKAGNLHNAKYNTKVRDWYMDNLSGRTWITKGNATDSVKMGKQLAAYNAGPTKVLNALQRAKNDGVDIYDSFDWVSTKYLKPETVDYVNWILRNKTTGSHRNDTVYQENKHKYKK